MRGARERKPRKERPREERPRSSRSRPCPPPPPPLPVKEETPSALEPPPPPPPPPPPSAPNAASAALALALSALAAFLSSAAYSAAAPGALLGSSGSHRRTVWSSDPVTSSRPSAVHTTHRTRPSWPRHAATRVGASAASHTRATPSAPAVAAVASPSPPPGPGRHATSQSAWRHCGADLATTPRAPTTAKPPSAETLATHPRRGEAAAAARGATEPRQRASRAHERATRPAVSKPRGSTHHRRGYIRGSRVGARRRTRRSTRARRTPPGAGRRRDPPRAR